MRAAVMLAAMAASTFALAGCGGDDGASTTDATGTETVATAPPPPTESTNTTTTQAPQPQVIAIRVVGGDPQGGIQRPTIDQGREVVLVVRTDSGEGVHLHGYNIEKDVVPGTPVRIPFTANIPGRFEVELHPTDTLLAVLAVEP